MRTGRSNEKLKCQCSAVARTTGWFIAATGPRNLLTALRLKSAGGSSRVVGDATILA